MQIAIMFLCGKKKETALGRTPLPIATLAKTKNPIAATPVDKAEGVKIFSDVFS